MSWADSALKRENDGLMASTIRKAPQRAFDSQGSFGAECSTAARRMEHRGRRAAPGQPLGEELARQAVDVLVAPAVPEMVRVGEAHRGAEPVSQVGVSGFGPRRSAMKASVQVNVRSFAARFRPDTDSVQSAGCLLADRILIQSSPNPTVVIRNKLYRKSRIRREPGRCHRRRIE